MATTLVIGIEPSTNDIYRLEISNTPATEAQYIGIVVSSSHLPLVRRVAKRSTNTLELVRHNRHTDTRRADKQTSVCLPLQHSTTHLCSIMGVADNLGRMRSDIDHIQSPLIQIGRDRLFQQIPTMVISNAHTQPLHIPYRSSTTRFC